MINFETIKKSDINNFRQYYDYEAEIGCDVNPLTVYLWRNEYNIKFAVIDDTLMKAYFKNDGTVWGYTMPSGKNVKNALSMILSDAESRGIEPKFLMLSVGQRAMLETAFPSKFKYTRCPENQDYIYLSKDLATLQGKKFHAKRNHISKFYRNYPDAHFETMDNKNKTDMWKVYKLWCEENNLNIDRYSETPVFKEALELSNEFDMKGALLYVDDKPVAMTLGNATSDKVFDVNFEKALRKYDGVYAVINNEFSKTLTAYEYINREEDMGIEGLRKAKMSYNPVIIYDRFNAEMI